MLTKQPSLLRLFLAHPRKTMRAIEKRREAKTLALIARAEADQLRWRIREMGRSDLHRPQDAQTLAYEMLERLKDLTYWAAIAHQPIG